MLPCCNGAIADVGGASHYSFRFRTGIQAYAAFFDQRASRPVAALPIANWITNYSIAKFLIVARLNRDSTTR